ncbi:Homeobox-leucine zipper protein ROC4 [Hordeum vulgare]|nr:Homeobox-leucine zipper protein ROC4 [Hordeum vulgare]
MGTIIRSWVDRLSSSSEEETLLSNQPEIIISCMVTTMKLVIDESEEIQTAFASYLLQKARNEEKGPCPASFELAEKVISSCEDGKLKPIFLHVRSNEEKPGYVACTIAVSHYLFNTMARAQTILTIDERQWSSFFSCIIAEPSTIEEISTGAAGSRDGALLLMQAKLQVLSPLVPIREVTFLRFCKQFGEGLWVVVDISIDGLVMEQGLAVASTAANMKCRRLPSGCVMQEIPNGFCKATTKINRASSTALPLYAYGDHQLAYCKMHVCSRSA